MNRADRRRYEKLEKAKANKVRNLQAHIQQLRMEGVLPMTKPSLLQRIKGLLRKWQ